jgi:hypothetical protein
MLCYLGGRSLEPCARHAREACGRRCRQHDIRSVPGGGFGLIGVVRAGGLLVGGGLGARVVGIGHGSTLEGQPEYATVRVPLATYIRIGVIPQSVPFPRHPHHCGVLG